MPAEVFQQHLFRKFCLFVSSVAGAYLLFLWSFFEASIWFIAPDFLIMLYCFASTAKLSRILAIALAGSFLGGIAYYLFCISYPAQADSIIKATPFVTLQKGSFVSAFYEQYGVIGSFAQSVTLIPFKIWTNIAAHYHFSPFAYFPIVMASRFIRLGFAGLVAGWIRRALGVKLERHFVSVVILFSLLFLLIQTILE